MKLSTIQIVNSVSEITPSLFLTSAYAATRDNVERRGITLLVNCAQECPRQDYGPYVETVKVSVDDTPYAPISAHFDSVADKIHEHVHRGGRVLVHCLVGVSRSTTLLLAYLMKHRNMSLKTAFDMVSAKRSVVRPNPGFWRQLIDYEKKLMSMQSNNFGSNYYSRHTEIPIHISSQRATNPTMTTTASTNPSSSFISRPYSSSSNTSPSSSTYGGTRYIPVQHNPAPAPSFSPASINSRYNTDYGSNQYSSYPPPGSSANTNYSSSFSPSSLLDKFRKQSFFDKYVPTFSSSSNLIDDVTHNSPAAPRFGRSTPPYSTTYRSSYGRF